jgi:hypothetical protein
MASSQSSCLKNCLPYCSLERQDMITYPKNSAPYLSELLKQN